MKQKTKVKKKQKWKKPILTLLELFLLFSTGYLIYAITLYKNIETKIRIVGCITLVVLGLLLLSILTKYRYKPTAKGFLILTLIILLYCSGLTFIAHKTSNVYNKISIISSKKYNIHSTSIITKKNNIVDNINDISGTIGIINDKDDYEGYTLAHEIIDNKKLKNIKEYNNYIELLNDLLDDKIKYAFVPTQYESMLSDIEGLEDIKQETKIIYTKEDKKEKENNKVTKNFDEPFTVLIMGVDTIDDGFVSGFNADSLLLITFNPETTNTTILSIPRDTYMPISCMNNRKTKITNAGWRGQDCIIESLENYFDVKIDYHVKINFNGVVKLVDSLGGVEVDVPYSFCEQNSQRKWGKNTVFVESGKQKLNGEQALAFARHRKVTSYMVSYCGPKYTTNAGYWNDFTRGQNQQIVINSLVKKLKDIDDFNTIENIIDTISKNIETDISIENILSMYNLGKDMLKKSTNKNETFNMQRLYLQGHDAYIYDYSFKTNSGSKLVLYNYNIYKESKEEVIRAMKENIGLISPTPTKEFSFSIKDNYENYIIGKNVGTTSNLVLMPNFIGTNVNEAKNFTYKNNINLNINYVTSSNYKIGQIVYQSIPANTDLDMLNSNRNMTINVVNGISNNNKVQQKEEVENTNKEKENTNEEDPLDDLIPDNDKNPN